MYNNPYMQNYQPAFGQQSLNERIDNQIAQLNQMKEQLKNNAQPAINQTFQLAPSSHGMRYANTIEEVSKEVIYSDTPFFSKDMSVLWVKSAKGDIKTYELNEIVPKDAKDMQIEYLQAQINELKGKLENEPSIPNATNVNAEQNATDTTTNDRTAGEEFESNKSTSVSKVSRSKKEQ